jgi:hypothetical protein
MPATAEEPTCVKGEVNKGWRDKKGAELDGLYKRLTAVNEEVRKAEETEKNLVKAGKCVIRAIELGVYGYDRKMRVNEKIAKAEEDIACIELAINDARAKCVCANRGEVYSLPAYKTYEKAADKVPSDPLIKKIREKANDVKRCFDGDSLARMRRISVELGELELWTYYEIPVYSTPAYSTPVPAIERRAPAATPHVKPTELSPEVPSKSRTVPKDKSPKYKSTVTGVEEDARKRRETMERIGPGGINLDVRPEGHPEDLDRSEVLKLLKKPGS